MMRLILLRVRVRDGRGEKTSSRTTRLVHGGVRYLEKTWWQVPYYWAGTKMYDFIAGKENIESSYFMRRRKTLANFPMPKPENLKGAIVYYDGSHNDSRINTVLFLPRCIKLPCKDASGQVNVIQFLHIYGPFTDKIRTARYSRNGRHRRSFIRCAGYSSRILLIPKNRFDRSCYLRWASIVPWQGHSLVGPIPTEDDSSWILNEIQHYVADDVTVRREDLLAAWSGIRCFVRKHLITLSGNGLLTDTVNTAVKVFGLQPTGPCRTKDIKLVGSEGYRNLTLKLMFIRLIQTFGIETEIAKHLTDDYEMAYRMYIKLGSAYLFIDGEVRYAVPYEHARTAVDVPSRRIRLASLNSAAALESLPKVIDIMSSKVKWDNTCQEKEWNDSIMFLCSTGPENGKYFSRVEIESGKQKRWKFVSREKSRSSLIPFIDSRRNNWLRGHTQISRSGYTPWGWRFLDAEIPSWDSTTLSDYEKVTNDCHNVRTLE
ncbi:hypothetical protein V1524DRAFT_460532 [Lipomyces starkeyi]